MRCTSGGLGLDELLQKVAEEEDGDKRVLMTQLMRMALEKEVIQKQMEIEMLKRDQLNNELLSLKGELTARHLLERCVHKIKNEIPMKAQEFSRQSTKRVLGNVRNLQESACAQKLVAAVRDCNGQESFAGRFYQDMYAELSGKIRYPRWTGPEILVDGD